MPTSELNKDFYKFNINVNAHPVIALHIESKDNVCLTVMIDVNSITSR